ncbi:hypothetical protein BC826DRAFT_984666 [Russula brevipes]|nr:hypothetical protein BC826DRAFT_1057318 [Russula brevipes]KAI0302503.1 hypothetical protein BC826DRAFT_984666 [Russula brevipes]
MCLCKPNKTPESSVPEVEVLQSPEPTQVRSCPANQYTASDHHSVTQRAPSLELNSFQ